jgi:hypothetical protein
MKYVKLVAGPVSALSITALASPFWWLRMSDEPYYFAIGWTVVWLIVEVIFILRKQTTPSRLLTHLRWGPIAVMLIALSTVLTFDQVKTYLSKHQISQYVYYGLPGMEITGRLDLYSNYRGWCGNGMAYAVYDTYIDTATEGFDSSDPAVRLRALKVSHEISSWDRDQRFDRLLDKALEDVDPTVQALAFEYKSRLGMAPGY